MKKILRYSRIFVRKKLLSHLTIIEKTYLFIVKNIYHQQQSHPSPAPKIKRKNPSH